MYCHFTIESLKSPPTSCYTPRSTSVTSTNIWGILNRKHLKRFNDRGQCVRLCEKRKQAVTGTLLLDFWVTPSCVTAVTDNTFCQTCCFPSCYCVVLQYHVLMSDTLLNAFSLEGFLFYFFASPGHSVAEYSSSNAQVNH